MICEGTGQHLQPPGRAGHVFCKRDATSALLVGGYGEDGPLDDVWLLDVARGVWVCVLYDKMRSHPLPRVDFAGCLLGTGGHGGGYFYLVGGMASDGEQVLIYNDLWSLELSTGVWTRLMEECPFSERMGHACVAIDEGNMLVHGGQCMGNVFGDAWLYQALTNAWVPFDLASTSLYPTPRCAHSACFIKECATFILFGGYSIEDGEPIYLNDLWALDLSAFNVSSTTANPPTWRCMIAPESGICPSPRDLPAMAVVPSPSPQLVILGGFGLTEIGRTGVLDSDIDLKNFETDMGTEGEEESISKRVELNYLGDCWIVDLDFGLNSAIYMEIGPQDGRFWTDDTRVGESLRGCTIVVQEDGTLISFGGFTGDAFTNRLTRRRFKHNCI